MNIRYPIYEGVYRILTVFLVFNYMVFKPQRKLLLKGGI